MEDLNVLKTAIGEAIRSLRKETGISQQALAKKAGKSRFWLTAIEKGVNYPTLEGVYLIANALGRSIRDILPDNLDESNNPIIAPYIDPMNQEDILKKLKKLERMHG